MKKILFAIVMMLGVVATYSQRQASLRPFRIPNRPLNPGVNLGPSLPPGNKPSSPHGSGVNWGFPGNPIPARPLSVNFPPPPNQSGVVSVVGCGYDDMGVWRTVPMSVSYSYNGAWYNATVLSAWNPWIDAWSTGIDVGAISTSYYLNGVTYNFYVVLSTGTYYFNL